MRKLVKHWIREKDGTLRECDDLMEWARWMEARQEDCIIARTQVEGAYVSTAFLSLDHNFSGKGPPILFETMIFGSRLDETQWRYSTEEEARKGHERAVELVKASVERKVRRKIE